MELRQLKYFKEACELQNFSEAARVLHISQSTLSQQIKQLEEELDVLLFDRIGKRIVPTESHPKVKIMVTIGTSAQMMEGLKSNTLDFVLSFDAEEEWGDMDRIALFTSHLFVVMHRTHPFSGLSSITLKKLQQLTFILPERGFATRKRVDAICRRHGLELQVGIEINDVHTILHMLAGGKWATIMSEAAVHGEAYLVCIPILCADQTASKAYLFWPQGIYRKNSALAFAACLQEITAG